MCSRILASALKVRGPHGNSEFTCSSGYLAAINAAQHIQDSTCAIAVAGGISLKLKADWTVVNLAASILSPTGRMKPLDATADGTVWSEASCAVTLSQDASNKLKYAELVGWAHETTSCAYSLLFDDSNAMESAATQACTSSPTHGTCIAMCHLHAMGSSGSDIPEV